MPILGAHMSIAGGYYKAIEGGLGVECDCVQLFTKNNNQWRAKPISDKDIELFQNARGEAAIEHCLSHASYLINIASPKEELRTKSIDSLIVELERADMLGIPFVVFHPGSYTTTDEETGLNTIVESMNQVIRATQALESTLLLENTAGQGSNLGFDFAHLEQIISSVDEPDRVGVCIDTCHAFAAGYPMGSEEDYESTMKKMDQTFGLKKIRSFHLNDSKKPFDSRKDRHEHIGEGEMGLEPFRFLLNDARFSNIPMYLETEKGDRDGEDFDAMNLRVLRSLIKS